MGRCQIGRGAVIAVLVGLLSAVPALASPGGQITRSVTNSGGTLGSFAGSATYDGSGCPNLDATPCGWIAVLTVQPASITPPLYPCNADNWRYGGNASVLVTWNSTPQASYGTVPFDGGSFPILRGVESQRLCLYLGYPAVEFPNYTCADADPYCPPGVTEMQFTIVASAVFRPGTSGGGGGGGDPGDPGSLDGGSSGGSGGGTKSVPFTINEKPTATLAKATAVARAKAALKRRYGRAYTRGKKRVTCKRRSAKEYRCTYSLRYRRKTRRGTVTVKRTSDDVKATVKPR
jgi:hypothetical protein